MIPDFAILLLEFQFVRITGEMKFFCEFVSCCGAPPLPAVVPEESRQVEIRKRYRKERMGSSRSSSSSSVEWQPSLSSISEDNVIPEKEERSAEPERTPTRKAASGAKIHVRSYSEDYGYLLYDVVVTD